MVTEETNFGTRRCCLETSRREVAVRDEMEQDNGQFGQRVHLDPLSSQGRAYMHDMSGCWNVGPSEGLGWGTP
eukprot:7854826-Karenia_brevis.AAC.1